MQARRPVVTYKFAGLLYDAARWGKGMTDAELVRELAWLHRTAMAGEQGKTPEGRNCAPAETCRVMAHRLAELVLTLQRERSLAKASLLGGNPKRST